MLSPLLDEGDTADTDIGTLEFPDTLVELSEEEEEVEVVVVTLVDSGRISDSSSDIKDQEFPDFMTTKATRE